MKYLRNLSEKQASLKSILLLDSNFLFHKKHPRLTRKEKETQLDLLSKSFGENYRGPVYILWTVFQKNDFWTLKIWIPHPKPFSGALYV
jgi:hypothetical protein